MKKQQWLYPGVNERNYPPIVSVVLLSHLPLRIPPPLFSWMWTLLCAALLTRLSLSRRCAKIWRRSLRLWRRLGRICRIRWKPRRWNCSRSWMNSRWDSPAKSAFLNWTPWIWKFPWRGTDFEYLLRIIMWCFPFLPFVCSGYDAGKMIHYWFYAFCWLCLLICIPQCFPCWIGMRYPCLVFDCGWIVSLYGIPLSLVVHWMAVGGCICGHATVLLLSINDRRFILNTKCQFTRLDFFSPSRSRGGSWPHWE